MTHAQAVASLNRQIRALTSLRDRFVATPTGTTTRARSRQGRATRSADTTRRRSSRARSARRKTSAPQTSATQS